MMESRLGEMIVDVPVKKTFEGMIWKMHGVWGPDMLASSQPAH